MRDFGSSGIWIYNGTTWSQITMVIRKLWRPQVRFCMRDFGSNGIWQWNGTTWSRITTGNPEAWWPQVRFCMETSEVTVSGNGMAPHGAGLHQVIRKHGGRQVRFCMRDFGSNGIWQWNGTAWSRINATNPETMVASGSILYASFTGSWPL